MKGQRRKKTTTSRDSQASSATLKKKSQETNDGSSVAEMGRVDDEKVVKETKETKGVVKEAEVTKEMKEVKEKRKEKNIEERERRKKSGWSWEWRLLFKCVNVFATMFFFSMCFNVFNVFGRYPGGCPMSKITNRWYPTSLSPPRWVFVLWWPLIVVPMTFFMLQLVFTNSNKSEIEKSVWRKYKWLLVVQGSWLMSWSYKHIYLSAAIVFPYTLLLLDFYLVLQKYYNGLPTPRSQSGLQRALIQIARFALIRLPVSAWFGWISMIAIVNITIAFQYFEDLESFMNYDQFVHSVPWIFSCWIWISVMAIWTLFAHNDFVYILIVMIYFSGMDFVTITKYVIDFPNKFIVREFPWIAYYVLLSLFVLKLVAVLFNRKSSLPSPKKSNNKSK